MTTDDFGDLLDGPLPARVRKVLDKAEEEGWSEVTVTLTVRFSKPDDKPEPRTQAVALPFFITWKMHTTPKGNRGWQLHSARAKNGQALSYDDCLEVLADPSLVYPEPPEEEA